jgi:hypothetical protein
MKFFFMITLISVFMNLEVFAQLEPVKPKCREKSFSDLLEASAIKTEPLGATPVPLSSTDEGKYKKDIISLCKLAADVVTEAFVDLCEQTCTFKCDYYIQAEAEISCESSALVGVEGDFVSLSSGFASLSSCTCIPKSKVVLKIK